MSDFEEFVDCLGDATKQLFEEIGEAWDELKTDLREVVTVRYLRPGSVAYCRADGKKYYGILTGTQIISLNAEKEPEYMELEEFLGRRLSRLPERTGSRSEATMWISPRGKQSKRNVSLPQKHLS